MGSKGKEIGHFPTIPTADAPRARRPAALKGGIAGPPLQRRTEVGVFK